MSNEMFNHSVSFLLNSLRRFRGGAKTQKMKAKRAKAIVSCPNQSTDFFLPLLADEIVSMTFKASPLNFFSLLSPLISNE